jgi:hypothetical protein
MLDAIEIIERLKKVLNANTSKELAIKLNTKQKTIESWVHRKSIPISKIIPILIKHEISLDYILYNKTNHTKNPKSNIPTCSTSIEYKILENLYKLDPIKLNYYYHKTKADALESEIEEKNRKMVS